MEYRAAQQWTIRTRTSVRTGARWSPPPDGSYKANFDAATFKEDERTGIGVILRNNKGLVMASASQNIQLMTSMVEMEAMAAI